jgi:ABC-type phosphate/phosphonate transport system ATPase subunit
VKSRDKLSALVNGAPRVQRADTFSSPGVCSSLGTVEGKLAIMIWAPAFPQLFTKNDRQQVSASLEAMGMIPGDMVFKSGRWKSSLSQGQQDEVDKARRMCDAVDKLLADGKPDKALQKAQKALQTHQRILGPISLTADISW